MSQQGITDPEGFVADETSGFLLGALLVPVVFALIFIIFMGAMAFSSFLGGPYLAAKIIFFILLVPYTIFGILIAALIAFVRKISRNMVQKGRETIQVTVEELNK